MRLTTSEFLTVIKGTPLISIDLLVRNEQGQYLLGMRTNEPARGKWFVPGGRITKDERVSEALARISVQELGINVALCDAELIGVFEHIYHSNFAEVPGVSTHYVVLAYQISLPSATNVLRDGQHSQMRWMTPEEITTDHEVHKNTSAYFKPPTHEEPYVTICGSIEQ